jgi:hypothetical protein
MNRVYHNVSGECLFVSPPEVDVNSPEIQVVVLVQARSEEDRILWCAFDVLSKEGRISKAKLGKAACISHGEKWTSFVAVFEKWQLSRWKLEDEFPPDGKRVIVWSQEKIGFWICPFDELFLVGMPVADEYYPWEILITHEENTVRAKFVTVVQEHGLVRVATAAETAIAVKKGRKLPIQVLKDWFWRVFHGKADTDYGDVE